MQHPELARTLRTSPRTNELLGRVSVVPLPRISSLAENAAYFLVLSALWGVILYMALVSAVS